MKPVIYRNTRFEKCLGAMRRSGGGAALAARRAAEIIRRLAARDGRLREMGKVTRNGEARIRNCVKFDLGGGYRLICRKEGDRLVMVYAGAHDACDRWINNNRVRQPDTLGRTSIVAVPSKGPDATESREGDGDPGHGYAPSEDYEDLLERRISEKDLRSIFSGLLRRPSVDSVNRGACSA